ncbi:uncharacterized protein LOC122508244 [Leptopilina heterotoma]|uniref:uncharacterized protein LOC122508244 n=1 Tax=Leptopilina heterotoma TaxID=63436 RepID=UPI001CA886E1|nr:uncharacterized protein LOC122508244 [Leptopilina heterotoma]XP_043477421.1 uncharacterized protein LOC122508244 [Leptopilina heterotoma]
MEKKNDNVNSDRSPPSRHENEIRRVEELNNFHRRAVSRPFIQVLPSSNPLPQFNLSSNRPVELENRPPQQTSPRIQRTVSSPFIPVLPFESNEGRVRRPLFDPTSMEEAFSSTSGITEEEVSLDEIPSNVQIEKFQFFDENTRMSVGSGVDYCKSKEHDFDDDTTLSWQRNLGLMNIVSSSSFKDSSTPMDIDNEEEETTSSPTPKKRYKLNLKEEKLVEDVFSQQSTSKEQKLGRKTPLKKKKSLSPIPSTSRQADENDYLQSLNLQEEKDSTFKIPEPLATPSNMKKTTKSTSRKEKQQQTKFTIKTGFESFCPNEQIRTIVNDQVQMLSRMFILISLFVNFALRHPTNTFLLDEWSKNGPDYLTITYLFKEKEPVKSTKNAFLKKLREEFVPEFSEYMGRPFEKFDCTNLTSQVQQMAAQMNTNFTTNLTTHCRNRLAKFFKNELLKKSPSYKERKSRVIDEKSIEERDMKRKEEKRKRARKNKKKRIKWDKKKRMKRKSGRQKRIEKHNKCRNLYPNNKKMRDKLINIQSKTEQKSRNVDLRKIVYDARKTIGRNRGKKKSSKKPRIQPPKKPPKTTPKNKPCRNLPKEKTPENETSDTTSATIEKDIAEEEEEKEKEGYTIKTLIDNLLLNKCESEKLNQMNLEKLNFGDMTSKDECHKFLPFYIRLQKYFIDEKIKGFMLVPIMKPGLKYICYTNTALSDLEIVFKKKQNKTGEKKPTKKMTRAEISKQEAEHKKLISPVKEKHKKLSSDKKILTRDIKLIKSEKNPHNKKRLAELELKLKVLNEDLSIINSELKKITEVHKKVVTERNQDKYLENERRWEKLFNFSKLRVNKTKYKFSGTIMTDGIAVSVIYNVIKPKKIIDFLPTEQGDVRDKTKYKILKGLDPGLKLAFGGVEREMQQDFDINSKDKPIKIPTATFRFETQECKRRSILYKVGNDPITYYENLLDTPEFKDKVNHRDPSLIIPSTKFLLRTFYDQQPNMENKKIARLRWDKYMLVQRETDYLADYLVGNREEKQLIAIGSPKISPWMRGHVRMPLKKVVRRLAEEQDKYKNLRLVFVDEFNTTKMCSTCNQKMKIMKNRTAYCSSCRIAWNRDVNAGRNILNLALVRLGIIQKEQLPDSTKFRAIAKIE